MSDEQTTTAEAEDTSPQVPPTETGEGDKAPEQPNEATIPKQRLDAEIASRRKLEKELAEFRKKQEAEDEEAAKKAGDIERFSAENKDLRAQLATYRERDEKRYESIKEGLSDDDLAIIDALGEEATLSQRLAVADRLQSQGRQETPAPSFGTNGGGKAPEAGGKIPPGVTSPADYDRWLASLNSTAEGRALLVDKEAFKLVRAEAKRRKLR